MLDQPAPAAVLRSTAPHTKRRPSITPQAASALCPSAGRLDPTGLRLAILDILLEPRVKDRTLTRAIERLWREDPEEVTEAFDEIMLSRMEDGRQSNEAGRHGLRAERMRELRRPFPRVTRMGLPVAEVAERAGLSRETTARLLEANGYLETSPFGGRQSRRLVSLAVREAGHGHNADPSDKRSLRLDGGAKAAPFPVFYEEHAADIIWTLGWDTIMGRCASETSKKLRSAWLLKDHAYLPDEEIGRLAGYSRDGVIRARKRLRGQLALRDLAA